ncbi:hypothetical protein HXX76_009806 [Chlamydomonas incerta]|uniref:Uncharacterized protein n=1 Tax=Chlamydomonas incerta TaxID=51695 RepID=A0A835SSW3_CHLIN|nr:hypothetical protein HXX76_009806 [Chlamydomonas incerta]|eukprot:KAG2430832.1 hypothetical protein HXX76_009806 [Chlamydomonas incerta]
MPPQRQLAHGGRGGREPRRHEQYTTRRGAGPWPRGQAASSSAGPASTSAQQSFAAAGVDLGMSMSVVASRRVGSRRVVVWAATASVGTNSAGASSNSSRRRGDAEKRQSRTPSSPTVLARRIAEVCTGGRGKLSAAELPAAAAAPAASIASSAGQAAARASKQAGGGGGSGGSSMQRWWRRHQRQAALLLLLAAALASQQSQALDLSSLQLPSFSGPLPLLVLVAERPLPNEPKAPAALLVSGCGPTAGDPAAGGGGGGGSGGAAAARGVTASSGAPDNATASAGGWSCCLGCGLPPQYAGPAAAELRGRSSQAADKKSYALELQGPDGKAQEVSLLGMAPASDWVLASLALDRSLVRDALAFTLARAQGRWAPHAVFVELFVVTDGSDRLDPDRHYRGVYALTEPVARGRGRLDLKSMPGSAAADPASGGLILELSNAAATQWWASELGEQLPAPVLRLGPTRADFKYPKAERAPPSVWGYASSQLSALAAAATGHDDVSGGGGGSPGSGGGGPPSRQRLAVAADVASLVDFLLHTELACDYDGYVSSVFLHKDAGKQLAAGPVWDKNLAFGNEVEVSSPTGCGWRYAAAAVQNSGAAAQWYGRLAAAAWWRAEVAARWRQLRNPQGGAWSDAALVAAVDGLKGRLQAGGAAGDAAGGGGGGGGEGPAVGRNSRRWPPQSVRSGQRFVTLPPARGSWGDEVAALRAWLLARAAWMDGMLLGGGGGGGGSGGGSSGGSGGSGGGGGGGGGGGADAAGVQLWVPAQPNLVNGVMGAVMAGRPVTRAFREGLGL